jgi:predicted PurR-regulated permease PerM
LARSKTSRNRLGLPVLFLFFGLLGGLALFGAIGSIRGPALFALLDLYSEECAKMESE